MTDSFLSLTGVSETPAVRIGPDAIMQKQTAIEYAQEIVAVGSPAQNQDCVAAMSIIKGLLDKMEETRSTVKRPALDACQTIDRIAKGYTDTLATEYKRLQKLSGAFVQEQQDRINAEAAAEIADMASDQDMSEEAIRARTVRTIELRQPVKVEGAQVRSGLEYEIMDALALATARPDLVTIEPKRRDLLAYINIPNMPALPGVRTFSQTILHAKAS
jgi:hypothetical protein